MRCFRQLALPILVSTALAGCAGTTPGGRAQFTAPSAVSSLYSSIDMNLHLASASPVAAPCSGSQCRLDRAFDRQVERTGNRLARAAYELDPQLQDRVPAFTFVVAEKSDAGSASDASGSIVVFRGVRENGLDETALAYVMAREMGRVMARHHDEKSATTILTTILAQLLVPALSLTGGIAFLATSAASAAGTKAIASSTTEERTQEADALALKLMARQGWSSGEIVTSLKKYVRNLGNDAWSQELRNSVVSLSRRKEKQSLVLAEKAAGEFDR